ncbi:MAG TPA: ABC transporter ATP-binding protein [Acidimicrobiales bacterium]|nr:ABC transporter ATP-binding protein [Acidimicrobiales bacterium]
MIPLQALAKERLGWRGWLRAAQATVTITLRADRGRAVASGVLFGVAPLMGVLVALWLKQLVNAAAEGHAHAVLRSAAVLGVTAAVLAFAIWSGVNVLIPLLERVSAYVDRRLIELTAATSGLEHYERADHADRLEILRQQRGLLASASAIFVQGMGAIVQAVGTVALLVHEDPQLLFLPLFGIPTVLATAWSVQRTQQAADAAAEDTRAARHLFDVATTAAPAKEMRIFGLQPKLVNRHRTTWRRVERVQDAASLGSTAVVSLSWLFFALGYGLAIFLMIRRAVHGRATIGDVVLVIALAASINQLVSQTVGMVAALAQCLRIAHRFVWLSDLHSASERADRARDGVAPERLSQGILIEGLCFAYPGTTEEILAGVDLVLPAGSTVALVGENGAGKTTLIKLLTGMYQPSGGRILVDGVDLTSIDRGKWRSRVTAGFQDFAKFEFVARQAVGVGALPHLDDDGAVRAALQRAHGSDVIDAMENGLDTQLGKAFSDGAELSGGQWQKLALGRAMMREDPLLLVLDEPTASLDAETEHALFERYASAAATAADRSGSITVLVSHRFSTVRMADLIVVLAGGRVIEAGSHEELMEAGGTYAELYELQARAYR